MKARFFTGFRELISEWSRRWKHANGCAGVIGKSFMMSIGSRCFIYLWDSSLVLELWCSYFNAKCRSTDGRSFLRCVMGEKSNYMFPHTSRLLKEHVHFKCLKRELSSKRKT